MSVSISKCKDHGKIQWRVRWHESGKVKRKFFTGRDAADAHAAKVRGEAVGVRQLLAAIPQHEQEKLVMVFNEAKRRGVDVLTFLHHAPVAATGSPAIDTVISEMVAAKQTVGRDKRYLRGLQCVLNEFVKGREKMPINQIGLPEIEAYLNTKNLISRLSFRGMLSTLFNFAIRKGYMLADPCRRLESITVTRPPPAVLTVEQTKLCLKWLRKNPRCFGWFVLSTFAGLRPEEAEKTTWADINFDEGWIRVEAQTTKVRQRRVVYPLPMAMGWLRAVQKTKAKLTVGRNTRSNTLVHLRRVVGWPKWKKDATRHSCASYWLSSSGNASTVATALGHSEAMLRKHYMALVTKSESEKFWSLTAQAV